MEQNLDTKIKLTLLLIGVLLGAVLSTPSATAESQKTGYDGILKNENFRKFYYGVSESCLVCHGNYKLFETQGSQLKYYYIDRETFADSVHAEIGCLGCHQAMIGSVHSIAKNSNAPSVKSAEVVLRLKTCDGCHSKERSEYQQSVHAIAAIRYRIEDAPLCVDCHGAHYIFPPTNPRAHTYPANVPILCAKCHANSEVYARYGLNPAVVSTYSESFHGKKEALGYKPVPVCNSCHGTHLIYATDDERSLVNDANISKTCGRCHPGATKSFKAAFSHRAVSPLQKAILFYVEQFYLWMILITIGGMIIVIVINLTYYLARRGLRL